MFEAVGEHAAGKMSDEEVVEYENKVCPTCGSCSGMYTANSMNCLTEVLGMGLKGNGTIPAVYSERIRLAKIGRHADHGAAEKRHPPERHHDGEGIYERTDCRYGAWLFNKQHAASSGNCT